MNLLIKQEPDIVQGQGDGWGGEVDEDQVVVAFPISGNIKKNGIIIQQKYKERARR